jgi:hypothetical protein
LFLICGLLVIILVVSLIIGISFMSKDITLSDTTEAPIWRGIVPGRTTEQEMLNTLGSPDSIVTCELVERITIQTVVNCIFGPLTYQYKDAQLLNGLIPTHKVRFKSGKVWVIIEDQVGYPEISVEEFVRQHGLPEKVTWSKLRPSLRAILFCDKGIMVQGGKYVTEIYYFQPMSLDACLDKFKNEVATQNPFPDSDFLGPENPYNFNEQK